jgi:trimeric autotransporter adhesin
MSTKTVKQRIAVVAVSALTAGLFSVVSTPAANAAVVAFADDATNAAITASKLDIAIKTGATPAASATIGSNISGPLATTVSYDNGAARTTGQTVVARADTALALYTGDCATTITKCMITVSGGTFSGLIGTGGTPAAALSAVAGSVNQAAFSSGSTSTVVLWTPGTAGTYTIRLYTGAAVTADFSNLTAGTLTAEITAYIIPASNFSSFAGTAVCSQTDSSGAQTTVGSQVVSATIARSGTVTVGTTTVNDVVLVNGTGALATSSTGTLASDGKSAVLGARNNTVTVTATDLGTFTLTSNATGAPSAALDTITITVVQSCATSGFSVNNSFIENQAPGAISVANDNVDDVPGWTNGQTAQIALNIKNAYNTSVPTGTWVVSATNGALVGISSGSNTTAVTAGSTSMASVVGTGADIKVGIAQGTENAPLVSTVTVSYGSVVVLTRTIAITGDVARLAITSVETGATGTINFRNFKASAYDSAGNRVSVNPSADASTLDQNVTAADIGTTSVSADIQDTNTFTCGTGAKGTTNVVFQVTATSGATIKSAPVALKCASTTRTYTASLDKASYVPGDIATLTISAKDVNGNAPFDSHKTASTGAADDTFNYVNGSNAIPSIAGSQMTPVAALAAADEFAGGVKTYTFIVGSTEGSYQMAVNLTGITTDTAKTVAYKVASATAATSNADVLKAIVSLIASINKQIAALQKALLRR